MNKYSLIYILHTSFKFVDIHAFVRQAVKDHNLNNPPNREKRNPCTKLFHWGGDPFFTSTKGWLKWHVEMIFYEMSFQPYYGELAFQHPRWNDIFETLVDFKRKIDPIIFVSIKNEVNVISINKFDRFKKKTFPITIAMGKTSSRNK